VATSKDGESIPTEGCGSAKEEVRVARRMSVDAIMVNVDVSAFVTCR
jgi:hypothetical protein